MESAKPLIFQGKSAVFDALADILKAVKELNLGVSGFFALCFMALFVWGAKRSSAFTSGLSGEWKKLIDEGVQVRDALKADLEEARATNTRCEEALEELHRANLTLQRRCLALEARLNNLENGNR